MEKERNPLSPTQQQPSCLPPVRNPFKAPGKEDKASEWKKMQSGSLGAQDEEVRDGMGACQKENTDVAVVEKENDREYKFSDTCRGKPLPPGMKVKKKVSGEEKSVPERNSGGTLQDKVKSVSGGDPQADKTCVGQSNHPADETSKAPRDEAIPSRRASEDDGDDVVLVSVRPAAQKSPAAAVQTTLTTFPGFQPASKVKSQDDPRGLRGLLTSQLQQKKVSVVVHGGLTPAAPTSDSPSPPSLALRAFRPLCLW